MQTVTQYLRQHLFASLTGAATHPSLDELLETQWSHRFERLMRNRLVLGSFRYGVIRAAGKLPYDRAQDAIRRITAYRADGNMEHLVDAANMMMLEFVEGGPGRCWRPGDDGEHTQPKGV